MNTNQEKLLSMQKELSVRIEKIDQDFHNRHTSSKFSEQAVDRQNDDVLLNLKNEALVELEQINRALFKIENTGYGVCEKCHGDINQARLNAVPYARLCTNCAE